MGVRKILTIKPSRVGKEKRVHPKGLHPFFVEDAG
jgi:hypothetical protein